MSNDKYTKESGWILRQGEILSTADVVGELNALAKRVEELEALNSIAPSVEDGAVPDDTFIEEFQDWWGEHGQFVRSGGGDYERTFAFEAFRHLMPEVLAARRMLKN